MLLPHYELRQRFNLKISNLLLFSQKKTSHEIKV
jgi:hypothetical protein